MFTVLFIYFKHLHAPVERGLRDAVAHLCERAHHGHGALVRRVLRFSERQRHVHLVRAHLIGQGTENMLMQGI